MQGPHRVDAVSLAVITMPQGTTTGDKHTRKPDADVDADASQQENEIMPNGYAMSGQMLFVRLLPEALANG
ncbi:hypothetical protein PC129_g25228 [Phytophthora cactorum]|uniref:Uncharacterized protein n=1 Tax=Phytophthora cactorum TaxID=29920 RepID=A0A8T1GXA4_9STRA|nr:hypothetical protein PC129_g25228 [Phytophthora cactorum]